MTLTLRLLLCLAALLGMASAHPDPRHTLEELDADLVQTPSDPALHLAKAKVYRGLKLFAEASAAVEAAEKLSPKDPRNEYERAYNDLAAGQPEPARKRLLVLTAAHPDYPEPWQLLGRIQRDAGEADAGIESLRKYLALARHSAPDDFTDLAARLSHRARPGDKEEAVTVLDQAAARFGGLLGVQLMALDLEVELGRTDPALKRLDALAVKFRPRPEWSIRRGDLLLGSHRPQEAASAYDAALALLAALPAEKRDQNEPQRLRQLAEAGKKAAQQP